MVSINLAVTTISAPHPCRRCHGIGTMFAMLLASVIALLVCTSSGTAAEVDSDKHALALRIAGDQLDELKSIRDQLTKNQDAMRRFSSDATERAKKIRSLNGEFRQKVVEAQAISDKNAEYWQALDNYEANAQAAEWEATSVEQEVQQACSPVGGANAVDSDSVARVKQQAAAVIQRIPQPLPFKLMEQTVKTRSAAFDKSLSQAILLESETGIERNAIAQDMLELELLEREFSKAQQRAVDLRTKLTQAAGQIPAAEFRALAEAKNLRLMIEGGTVDPNRLVLPAAVDTSASKQWGQAAKKIYQEQQDAISGSAGLLGSGKSPDKLLLRLKNVKARFEAISKQVNAAVTRVGSCTSSSGAGAVQGQPCDKGGGCPQGTQCGPQNTCVPKPPVSGIQEVQFGRVVFDAAEEAGEASVMLSRTGGTTGRLTVRYRTVDPNDKTSKYYRAATGTVTWEEGDSKPQSIQVPIINDEVYVGSRSYTIELFDPHNPVAAVRLGYQWQAMLYIIEDDLPPEPKVPPEQLPICSYLIIQPQNVEVAPNRSVTFTATAVFDKGGRSNVTAEAIWQATAGTAAQVSPRQTWLLSPGSTYTAPGNLRNNQNVTITATWDNCKGETTLNALAPSWSPPLSHADDLGARGETPGPLEFRHYVLCDRTGHVVTGTSYNPVDFGWMAGPIGARHANQWIEQNCPEPSLCTIEGTQGICAKEAPLAPTGGDAYYALCDKTGHVVISRSANLSGHVQLSPYALTGAAGARWWIEKNCPSWACTSSGACASAGQIRFGGKWAVVCSKRHGGVGLTEYPNTVDSTVWVEHLLTDGDAKNWIAKNCPSERCDQNGLCLPGAAPQGRPVEVPPEAVLEMFNKRDSSRQAGGSGGVFIGGGSRPGRFSATDLPGAGSLTDSGEGGHSHESGRQSDSALPGRNGGTQTSPVTPPIKLCTTDRDCPGAKCVSNVCTQAPATTKPPAVPSGTYEPKGSGQPCPKMRETIVARCSQIEQDCSRRNCTNGGYSGCALDCPGCGGTFPDFVAWCTLHPNYEPMATAGLSSFVSEIKTCTDQFLSDGKPGRRERGAECQGKAQKKLAVSKDTWVQLACQARCAQDGRSGVAVLGGARHRCECR